MKSYSSIIFFLSAFLIISCVNRIDIPEEEDSKLFISLEMLEGESQIVADLKTSNNLNGTFPISIPNSAVVIIKEVNSSGKDVNNEIELFYDENTGKYVSENTETFLGRNRTYKLVATVEDSEIEEITAVTTVPGRIIVDETELIDEKVVEIEGNTYWEGTVGLTFMQSSGNKDRYGYFVVEGFSTDIFISEEGDTMYHNSLDSEQFELTEVESGRGAVTDIVHRDGFLVDFTKLENDYLELVLRSPFAITKPNQITKTLNVDIYSVTVAHYNYHTSLHNIKKNQGNIFDEHALYNSNIKNGLGLFSSCMYKRNTIDLR